VIAVTRNECGDSRDGNPASFSRRFTSSQIRFDVMPLPDSFFVRPLPIRNNGDVCSDIIDLQDFAGDADPRTTLTYIRSRDPLSKSPAYVLKY
jgi:hypothetical protein